MLTQSYILLSLVIVILILFGYFKWNKRLLKVGEKQIKLSAFVIPFLIWMIYITALSFTDILMDYSFPPRFPIFVFIPFVVLLILFYWSNKNNASFKHLPLPWTTYFQSFRIPVEILIVYTFYQQIIPESATFEGFNFDIIMGVTALLMGYLVSKNFEKYKRLFMIWNILGIGMILFVFVIIATSIYRPDLWNSEVPLVAKEFVSFPYFFLPGILAPAGIFMHLVALIQVKNQ